MMEEIKKFRYLGLVLCSHGEMDQEIIKKTERRMWFTCMGFEMKECVHGGKERLRGQHYYANIDVWISDSDLEYGTTFKSVCFGKELFERDVWCDKMWRWNVCKWSSGMDE